MLLSSKSLNTVLDLYLSILLFVKLVFRAKLLMIIFSRFYKGIIYPTFHQYKYLLVSGPFSYTY